MSYCEFCGNALHENAVMCTNCKHIITKEFSITLKWKQTCLISSSIKYDIDGMYSGEIKNGETKQIKLNEGYHRITFYRKEHKMCNSVDIPNLKRNTAFILSIGTSGFTNKIDVFELC